jgi:hypothetical protein
LVAEEAMGFYVLGAGIFYEGCPEFKKLVHEGNLAVLIEYGWVTFE